MKKFLAIILTLALAVSMSAIFVSAEETSEPVADGFKFEIKGVNTSLAGEDGIIVTSKSALDKANFTWPIVIHCSKVEGNVYIVKADAFFANDKLITVKLEEGDILIGIHSSSSKMEEVIKFKNVPQKIAASKVKAGMYIELVGIDLETGKVIDGKAICTITKPEKTEESEISETSTAVSDGVSAEDSKIIESTDNTAFPESNVSEMPTNNDKNGLDTTTVLLICLAVIALVAGVGVVIAKKKK